MDRAEMNRGKREVLIKKLHGCCEREEEAEQTGSPPETALTKGRAKIEEWMEYAAFALEMDDRGEGRRGTGGR